MAVRHLAKRYVLQSKEKILKMHEQAYMAPIKKVKTLSNPYKTPIRESLFEVLEEGRCYYGRIDMPTFPRRQIALFFEALSSKIAKITLMHEDDKKDWSAYMAACERVMIRQMKGKESESAP